MFINTWILGISIAMLAVSGNAKPADSQNLNDAKVTNKHAFKERQAVLSKFKSDHLLVEKSIFAKIEKKNSIEASRYLRSVSKVISATLARLDVQPGLIAHVETNSVWAILNQLATPAQAQPTLPEDGESSNNDPEVGSPPVLDDDGAPSLDSASTTESIKMLLRTGPFSSLGKEKLGVADQGRVRARLEKIANRVDSNKLKQSDIDYIKSIKSNDPDYDHLFADTAKRLEDAKTSPKAAGAQNLQSSPLNTGASSTSPSNSSSATGATYSKQCVYAGYVMDRNEGETCNRAGILKDKAGFPKFMSDIGINDIAGCGNQVPCNPAIFGLEKTDSGYKAICVGTQGGRGVPESLTRQCVEKSKQENFDILAALLNDKKIPLSKLYDLVNDAADKVRDFCIGRDGESVIVKNAKDTSETCVSMIQGLLDAKAKLKNVDNLSNINFTEGEKASDHSQRFIDKNSPGRQ